VRTVRTVSELRSALAAHRLAGEIIGLVPTMGAFHDGHLALMRRAREDNEVVVVSLFVNPTQFNDAGDLEAYPRDERRDAALADELGVDFLFAPPVDAVYPPGFATSVSVTGVSQPLEGVHRGAGHFDGVATVVTKLLNMVSPDVAYFGQKDAQQLAVIRRLVTDLDIPVRIEAVPTVRAADGLALSSRNVLLSPAERERAPALHRALCALQEAVRRGERDARAAIQPGLEELTAAGIEPEYLAIVDPRTMLPVTAIDDDALALVAARLGMTRLIDNTPIQPSDAAPAAARRDKPQDTRRELRAPGRVEPQEELLNR
jgi:pantoate--beta-alanine ligase